MRYVCDFLRRWPFCYRLHFLSTPTRRYAASGRKQLLNNRHGAPLGSVLAQRTTLAFVRRLDSGPVRGKQGIPAKRANAWLALVRQSRWRSTTPPNLLEAEKRAAMERPQPVRIPRWGLVRTYTARALGEQGDLKAPGIEDHFRNLYQIAQEDA